MPRDSDCECDEREAWMRCFGLCLRGSATIKLKVRILTRKSFSQKNFR